MNNTPELYEDPVCQMKVKASARQTVYRGKTYYFCSEGCYNTFQAAPRTYSGIFAKIRILKKRLVKKKSPPAKATSSHTTQYTCPMHPEIVEPVLGSCPKCGMALEPILTTSAARHDDTAEMAAYLKLKKAFISSLLLTVPIMALEMIPAIGRAVPSATVITLVATTMIIFGPGRFILTRAYSALRHRTMNMFTLIALGTFTAYGYSTAMVILAAVAPERIPALALKADGMLGLYFETAAVIITLVLLGQLLEEAARKQTQQALKKLLDLAPATALRLKAAEQNLTPKHTDEEELPALPPEAFETVPLNEVIKGDILLVQPGAKVAVDGIVISGLSEVDESFLTGEAMLVKKTRGSRVLGGTINGIGAFMMRAEKVGAETFLAEVVTLTERAQRSHPPVQALVDRITHVFIPTVLGIAALSFLAWMLWGPEPAFEYALLAFVGVLIIACPCALGLATPMALTVGISRGAEKGVLIKDATLLEKFSAVTLIAIDKTGTLTHGKPRLADHTVFITAKNIPPDNLSDSPSLSEENPPQSTSSTTTANSRNTLLQIAASLEALSEHPLAKGMLAAAREAKLSLLPVTDFKASIGEGISGYIKGTRYTLGSIHMMNRIGVALPKTSYDANKTGTEEEKSHPNTKILSGTVLYLAANNQLLSTFTLRDTLKETAYETVAKLRARGIKIILLSGDNIRNCAEVTQALALDGFYGELRPQDKLRQLEAFKRTKHTVLMAGDGINDAPALAAADVSIAMGTGSDVALETAHATLLKGDLQSLDQLFTLSSKTLTTIKSNLFLAFFYNTASIPIAAGVLYPLWGVTLSPMIAALMMILSSISVIGNALRLKKSII
ncbi:copper-translocating P-type ATPase [Spirochaetota bacterium]|nr:copper-translocating P-type ATPase [Spirochaetota bacterium]